MIKQEKILKEGDHIAKRLNELELGLDEYKLLDWNPMFAIIFYEEKEETFGNMGKNKPEKNPVVPPAQR